MKQLLDPRKFRREQEVDVDLGDDLYVKARKADMTSLVLDGRLPMPVLVAVQKMIEMPTASPAERVKALGAQGGTLLELLRTHAVEAVTDPKLSLHDTLNPEILPVSYLTLQQLMAIWTATAVVPVVTPRIAAGFRGNGSADDDAVVPDGEAVSPGPVLVDRPDVEYVGQ